MRNSFYCNSRQGLLPALSQLGRSARYTHNVTFHSELKMNNDDASFNATIEYGKLAITLVSTLGAGAALALCTLFGTLSAANTGSIAFNLVSLKCAGYFFIGAAALPPLSAGLSYWAQGEYTRWTAMSTNTRRPQGPRMGNFWRYGAILTLMVGWACFAYGSWAAVSAIEASPSYTDSPRTSTSSK